VPGAAEAGIRFSSWEELDDDDRKYLDEVFEQRIFPVLTPLAVDPGHPFPYISNLSLNLAVMVRDPETGRARFARVKVPPLLPRFVVLPDGERFVPLEQVIAAHLDALFPGMEIEGTSPSGSPATPTSPSRRRRPTTCSPRSRWSCGAGASAGRAPRGRGDMSDEVASCSSASSTSTEDDVYGTDARSTWGACGRCTRSTAPT
jgi:hypothetical protein